MSNFFITQLYIKNWIQKYASGYCELQFHYFIADIWYRVIYIKFDL